jgi:hypothetical protein
MYRIICTAKIILHMKWSGIMVGSEDVQDSKYVVLPWTEEQICSSSLKEDLRGNSENDLKC